MAKTKIAMDSLDQIDADALRQMMISQGQQVLSVIQMPGWAIIEEALRLGRYNVVNDGSQTVKKDPTGGHALFHMGRLQGYEECRSKIYEIIQAAESAKGASSAGEEDE